MRVPIVTSATIAQQHQPAPLIASNNVNNNNNANRRSRSRSQYSEMPNENHFDKNNNNNNNGNGGMIAGGQPMAIPSSITPPPPNSASGTGSSSTPPELPSFLDDPVLNRTYSRGRYLGKGGFAWCYEVTDVRSHAVYALKVVPKTRVVKQRHREKVLREIQIHNPLRHLNVVHMYSAFEDELNIYIVLELCQQDSLVSVMKKRKTLTEYETRFYMMQLLTGVQFLHEKSRVLHRDLKLGNMLLTDEMQVKIADFGLAAEMGSDGCDRTGQVCGTPNYISPEVLRKTGHSSATEAWAIGCIMYAMLVGKPPFETNSLDATYSLILAHQYSFPPLCRISSSARDLIQKFLHPITSSRPTAAQALSHEFFASAIPKSLPVEACYSMPNTSQLTFTTSAAHAKTIQGPPVMTTTTHRIREMPPPQQVVMVRAATTASATTYHSQYYHRSSTPYEVLDENNGHLVVAKAQTPKSMAHSPTPQSMALTATSPQTPMLLTSRNYQPSHVYGSQNVVMPVMATYAHQQPAPTAITTMATMTTGSVSPYSVSTGGGNSQGNGFQTICPADSMGNISFGVCREGALTQWLYEVHHALNDAIYYSNACGPAGPSEVTNMPNNVLYVTKWIDYSNRYGFGCQFNNNGVSIMENSRTRLCLSADRRWCRRWHVTRQTGQHCVTNSDLIDLSNPTNIGNDSLELINHFVDYMEANLVTGGFSDGPVPLSAIVPFVVLWRRFSDYLLMVLSDGTFQINFVSLHTKVVLSRHPAVTSSSPSSSPNHSEKSQVALTFIDKTRRARTCPLANAITAGIIDQALLLRVRDLFADFVLTPNECFTAEI